MLSMRLALVSILVLWATAPPVCPQGIGPYLNFEAPPHKPIICTTAGSSSFLLVCNSADNSVEVYSTTTSSTSPSFLARVPCGLEPVTVAVKPSELEDDVRRCYAANWLGDSISIFDIAPNGTVVLRRTVYVGDEPTGIAFDTDEDLVVTFSARSSWGRFDWDDLQPLVSTARYSELIDFDGEFGIKDPRGIAFSPTEPDQLFILNFRGGNSLTFDYDLWGTDDITTSATTGRATMVNVGRLGSTNFNMAFASNGDLFVVGQIARNLEVSGDFVTDLGEGQMLNFVTGSTGFVTSQLLRLRAPGTGVHASEARDLNSTGAYQGDNVQATRPITQPTDLAIRGTGADDETRIFVTGFNSDTLGVVNVSGTIDTWTITRVNVAPSGAFSDTNTSGGMRGPRGLALDASQDYLYVYNSIAHSVTVIDATGATTGWILNSFDLADDPTPAYIKDGRKFLYSSKLSGGKNVSCASCHIDGTSDFLVWNLSNQTAIPNSPNNTNGNTGGNPGGDPEGWLGPNTTPSGANLANQKGPMQTQSLRGLVNYEVEDDRNQHRFYTNAPYHWRGDKETFEDFNGAFLDLMGITNPASSGKGLSDTDMTAFKDFINSIHYPPNPEEQLTRKYTGRAGPDNPPTSTQWNDPTVGSGATKGLKIFHMSNAGGGANTPNAPLRSCVMCHALPEGSNNRFNCNFGYWDPFDTATDPTSVLDMNGIECAALRGLIGKEKEIWRVNSTSGLVEVLSPGSSPVITGEFGLIHTGQRTLKPANIVAPVQHFQPGSISGFLEGFGGTPEDTLVHFLREFDTGVAPIIGRTLTLDAGNASSVGADLDLFEDQVEKANAEVAVFLVTPTTMRGFWYDVTDAAGTPYVEEVQSSLSGIGDQTRAQLITAASATDCFAVFQCTPLGTARRFAHLDLGPPSPIGTSAPSSIQLMPCRADTAYAVVTNMTHSWKNVFDVGYGDPPFTPGGGFNSRLHINIGHNKSLIWFQTSLINWGSAFLPSGYTYRHEPPRRFVVKGDGIKEGAWVRIYCPTWSDWGYATTTTPPTTTPTTTTNSDYFELPIFAVLAPDDPEEIEWETAAELDPYQLFALMNGGPESTPVVTAKDAPDTYTEGGLTASDVFQPQLFNWYYVEVINDRTSPSTTTGSGGWQRLMID